MATETTSRRWRGAPEFDFRRPLGSYRKNKKSEREAKFQLPWEFAGQLADLLEGGRYKSVIAWDAQDCCITIYDSDALADFVERSGVSKTRLVFLRMLSELGFRLSRGMPDGYSNPAITCVEDMRSVSMTTMQKRQASGTGGRGSEAGKASPP